LFGHVKPRADPQVPSVEIRTPAGLDGVADGDTVELRDETTALEELPIGLDFVAEELTTLLTGTVGARTEVVSELEEGWLGFVPEPH
jgi:hypothetical protein